MSMKSGKRLLLNIATVAAVASMEATLVACKDTRSDAAASQGAAETTELPTISIPSGVDGLRIKTPTADEVVLAKAGGVWRITAPAPGDADQAEVQGVVDNLGHLKAVEIVASKPDDGVLTTYNLDANHVVHVVATAAGQPACDVSFGKSTGRGQMARIGSASAVYAISGYSSYLYAGADRYRAPDRGAAIAGCAKGSLDSCVSACDANDLPSCVSLGQLRWKSTDTTARPLCAPPLRKACDGGLPRACSSLAFKLANVVVEPVLVETARKRQRVALASKACDQGDGLGCFLASKFASEGYGTVVQDSSQADALMKKALSSLGRECDASVAESCSALALQYEIGKHVAKDPAKAATLFKKGCDGGDDGGCAGIKQLASAGR